jgi:hypothetical protein
VVLVKDSSEGGGERMEFLFHHLVAMFQTLALQQLGKLVNPINGKLERDLQQAKITIDMLRMIQEKTAGNLSDNEKKLIDTVVMELQINYVDEQGREGSEPEDADQAAAGGGGEDETREEEKQEGETAAGEEAADARGEAGIGEEAVTGEDSTESSEISGPTKKGRKKSRGGGREDRK